MTKKQDPWQISKSVWVKNFLTVSPNVDPKFPAREYDSEIRMAFANNLPLSNTVLKEVPHLVQEQILKLGKRAGLDVGPLTKALQEGVPALRRLEEEVVNEQIVRYKNCDYRCYVKQMKSKKGTVYNRAICGKVDKKCGRPGAKKKTPKILVDAQTIKWMEEEGIQALMADLRLTIQGSTKGENLTDLQDKFKHYKGSDVKQALDALVADGSIKLMQKDAFTSVYVSTAPFKSITLTTEHQRFLTSAQEMITNIVPFPPPITDAQIFGRKHFHDFKQDTSKYVMEGHKYIGTPQTAILKTFRPELTKRMVKIQASKSWKGPGSEEYEEFKDEYDRVATQQSTEVEWKIAGMVPKTKGKMTELGHPEIDTAIFVSCKTGKVSQINARYIHIVQDVCDNVGYFSHGPESSMVAECQGKKVMVTTPLRMPLLQGYQEAITEILCRTL